MAREQWAKIDVDMPTDEKLFGRPLLERHLWTCLICLSKKQKIETGSYTIYNLDSAALSKRFNLGSPSKVERALKYFETCKPRPMVKRSPGAINLINIEKRQAVSKDTPEAAAERQRKWREAHPRNGAVTGPKTGVTGSITGEPVRDTTRDASVTRNVDEDEDLDRDLETRGEEISKLGSVPTSEQKRPPESWDPKLLGELREALGKTDLDHGWQEFVGLSLREPAEKRHLAVREFLQRGCARDGKGWRYCLAMIRDGAGSREHKNGNGAAPRQRDPNDPPTVEETTRMMAEQLPPPGTPKVPREVRQRLLGTATTARKPAR